MKIGILQTGTSPDELKDEHGDYNEFFVRLLDGRGFEFETFRVLDGDIPDDIHAAEGWLITGSRFGAYEDHPWIPPLEAFLREAYVANVPIFGVCFGHQILAQALGGKVEKFSGGWAVGPQRYEMADGSSETIMAWHQDQVTEKPEDAEVIGSSDFCRYAVLAYADKALSIQPHPEFTPEFVDGLAEARRNVLPQGLADQVKEKLEIPITSKRYTDKIEAFFKAARENS